MTPANHIISSRGQALVEFAVMGSLALLALAFMIQIGLRANYQQDISQQTFRRALSLAQQEGDDKESQSIQVQQFRDRQIPNPAQGFAIMPRTTTQGGATVTWGEALTFLDKERDSQPRIIVDLNGNAQEFRSDDLAAGQPLVRHISKRLSSTGAITQNNAGGSLETTTTESTTMTLNTTNHATVSSQLSSSCHFEGSNWTCR